MIGIQFDNHHSFDNFNLILSSKTIEAPSAKTESVNIPGADGELDFTEFFGETKFKNRKLKFEFRSIVPYSEQIEQYSEIKNALHGKKVHIILDADPSFYWIGRLSVGNWSQNKKRIGKLTITATCEPYKYMLNPTKVISTISEEKTLILSNLRKSVVPTITTDAQINITWSGGSTSLSAGTWTVPELVLRSGLTSITITTETTANVMIEYQEGSL